MSVKVVDIHLAALRHGKCPPLFTSTSLTNFKALKTSITLFTFLKLRGGVGEMLNWYPTGLCQ